ncbi:MAG: agmatine deiminase family protein, partial [Bacteroidales bacterium]|nr:agmatine deiminase family protein [Bacteroidales bacterium]
FVSIAKEIAQKELLVIVCADSKEVKQQLGTDINSDNIRLIELTSNDSWARDHGGISVFVNDEPYILDFCFNGWGLKFPANHDNQITRKLYYKGLFQANVGYQNMLHFVLEGGSIESDGNRTILTTAECLTSENRNEQQSQEELEEHLKMVLGAERILWLNNGFLEGDDTDSHIDTLARFCSEETIAYVQCADKNEEHYEELQLMEEELQAFTRLDGKPYNLIALPMADAITSDGKRLPATYANFIIINGAVLVPFYNTPKDEIAKRQLQKAFPDREIIGINCLPLIKQNGSLHCLTMQYPKGFIS